MKGCCVFSFPKEKPPFSYYTPLLTILTMKLVYFCIVVSEYKKMAGKKDSMMLQKREREEIEVKKML